MYKLTKIGADGAPLPDDATDHLIIRVERDILSRPIDVVNAMPPEDLLPKELPDWVASLQIHGRPVRWITIDELVMVPNYERPKCALDTTFFTRVDPDNWFISSTPYPRIAGACRGVNLVYGSGDWDYGDYWGRALAVLAGQ